MFDFIEDSQNSGTTASNTSPSSTTGHGAASIYTAGLQYQHRHHECRTWLCSLLRWPFCQNRAAVVVNLARKYRVQLPVLTAVAQVGASASRGKACIRILACAGGWQLYARGSCCILPQDCKQHEVPAAKCWKGLGCCVERQSL